MQSEVLALLALHKEDWKIHELKKNIYILARAKKFLKIKMNVYV